jgi:hypothetical protein
MVCIKIYIVKQMTSREELVENILNFETYRSFEETPSPQSAEGKKIVARRHARLPAHMAGVSLGRRRRRAISPPVMREMPDEETVKHEKMIAAIKKAIQIVVNMIGRERSTPTELQALKNILVSIINER